MAAEIRKSLASLLNSGLSPKDLTEKYRKTLSHIIELRSGELVEGLKSFIDAGLLVLNPFELSIKILGYLSVDIGLYGDRPDKSVIFSPKGLHRM